MIMLMRARQDRLDLSQRCLPVEKRNLSSPVLGRCGGCIPLGDSLEREGKLGSNAASSLGIESDGVPMDVSDIVTSLVVAWVLRISGASKEARGRNAKLKEANVVR